MRLVLLPGLDGTGNLFAPLIRSLSSFECKVIALPEKGSQDYVSLTRSVLERLPNEDFVLLAESFSGPIAAAITNAGIKNLKGVIFVATFLSTPKRSLVHLSRLLPIKLLLQLPFASYINKALFLDTSANVELVSLFQSTIGSLPPALIKARLKSINDLAGDLAPCEVPALYLQATSDRLVTVNKANEFKAVFKKIIFKKIKGPHFILQTNSAHCAIAIAEFIHNLTGEIDDALSLRQ